MLEEILKVSRIAKPRTKLEVMAYLMEEVGELSTEVMVDSGLSRKPVGEDGIIGEAVDCIICLMDIIYLENPMISTAAMADTVDTVIARKLDKWRGKISS